MCTFHFKVKTKSGYPSNCNWVPGSYKKFELMLTRRAEAYSSSCSQIALVYLQSFHCNSPLKCVAQPKIAKNKETLIFGVQGLSMSSVLIRLKSSSLGLIVIGSISLPICNRFHGRLANNGKITTFRGYCSLIPSCAGFLEPRKLRLEPFKSMFNAKNFVHSLSWSICSKFGAIRS